MKRSSRMRLLETVARQEEQQQAIAFGAAQKRVAEDRAKLRELEMYRNEYRGAIRSRSGSNAMTWQEQQKFLQRLDHAITAQHAVISEAEARREAHRKRWMRKRQRLESLGRALARYENDERREAERRESRELDDIPNRGGPFFRGS